MWQLNKSLLIVFLWLVLATPVAAQESLHITVETNQPEAIVYADTMRVGPASQKHFVVPASTRQIRLVISDAGSWSVEPLVAPITTSPGDSTTLTLNFPYYYRVESIPYGAIVYHEEAGAKIRLGETPITYKSAEPLSGALLLERDGYVSRRIEPGNELWNRQSIVLERAVRSQDVEVTEVDWMPPARSQSWIDYAALGLAATAGVLTIHYKFKADHLHDEFRRTGDPLLKERIETFDTRAAVSLAAMQVGVGVFALRLVFR